jgi:hypothetical protein
VTSRHRGPVSVDPLVDPGKSHPASEALDECPPFVEARSKRHGPEGGKIWVCQLRRSRVQASGETTSPRARSRRCGASLRPSWDDSEAMAALRPEEEAVRALLQEIL